MTLTITPLPVPLKEDPHGVVRIGGTRVTLDTVIGFFIRGTHPRRSPTASRRSGSPTSMP